MITGSFRCGAALILAMGAASPAAAAVVDVAQNGFQVRETAEIAAAPERVYAALVEPSRWWSSTHTFSGRSANLTLDARPGGCFCEKLANGGAVQHELIVLAMPGKELRLRGALGPLQAQGVEGAMSFRLAASGGGTEVTLTYALGGYMPEGFADWSKKTDAVLAEQLVRLKRLIETASPDAKTDG
ncbi:MAG TPA: SRPBCC domain-containing protein [Stellaceae bacterium]